MSEWIDVNESAPVHFQKCRTLGADGREFDCQYLKWNENTDGYFKFIGYVWSHDNVTHWKTLEG